MALTYPPGFFPATIEQNAEFNYFHLNYSNTPEIDFNDFIYFYSDTGFFMSRNIAQSDEVREIIANPERKQHKMNHLMMVNKDGVIFPAHLPMIADVVGRADVQAGIQQLEKEPEIVYEGVSYIIPKLMVNKVDPKPIIPRGGPIYTLKLNNSTTHFGSGTDAVQFMKVGSEMTSINFMVYRGKLMMDNPASRFHGVRLIPSLEDGKRILPRGATVVLWNGRRISRPSFIVHFREIVATHNPIFIILTEIGGTVTSCARVLDNLGTTMCWKVEGGGGLLGGSILLWDPSRVAASVTVADNPSIDLRMIGGLIPVEN